MTDGWWMFWLTARTIYIGLNGWIHLMNEHPNCTEWTIVLAISTSYEITEIICNRSNWLMLFVDQHNNMNAIPFNNYYNNNKKTTYNKINNSKCVIVYYK